MTSRQEQTKIIGRLSKKKDGKDGKDRYCHFQKHEIEKMITMFNQYVEGTSNNMLDRNRFREILHQQFNMTDDMLMDRVFRVFDKDNDSYLNHDEWVLGLSVFLRGYLEEKIKYCFAVYDLNGDGFIAREEMFQLLKHCLAKQPQEEDPDEGIKDLVELVLKKMDGDRDSRLSFVDFDTAVKEESLLLEVFGTCLPSPKKRECFLAFISDKSSPQ